MLERYAIGIFPYPVMIIKLEAFNKSQVKAHEDLDLVATMVFLRCLTDVASKVARFEAALKADFRGWMTGPYPLESMLPAMVIPWPST